MKISKKYSHLNGEEWLLVHQPTVYQKLREVIQSIDAEVYRTKISKEKRSQGTAFFNPRELNKAIDTQLRTLGWMEERYSYYIAHDYEQYIAMADMTLEEQREFLQEANANALRSYNQTDHVKNRIAVEVQFGKYAFVAYDLFVKHLAFYTDRRINVGIEILPTKAMQRQMSSGVAYYEGSCTKSCGPAGTTRPCPSFCSASSHDPFPLPSVV